MASIPLRGLTTDLGCLLSKGLPSGERFVVRRRRSPSVRNCSATFSFRARVGGKPLGLRLLSFGFARYSRVAFLTLPFSLSRRRLAAAFLCFARCCGLAFETLALGSASAFLRRCCSCASAASFRTRASSESRRFACASFWRCSSSSFRWASASSICLRSSGDSHDCQRLDDLAAEACYRLARCGRVDIGNGTSANRCFVAWRWPKARDDCAIAPRLRAPGPARTGSEKRGPHDRARVPAPRTLRIRICNNRC